MSSWMTRQRWILLVAAIFSAYVGVLLTNSYQAQRQLRSAAEARLLADARQTAGVLGDFMTEQRNFVRDLAESHEIETFLVNKALGMSMRYGLNANLYDMVESFRRRMAQKKILGTPIYTRIVYFDEDGAVLADTSPNGPASPLLQNHDSEPRVTIDGTQGLIMASIAVNYRDTHGGMLTTIANLELLSRYLSFASGDMGLRQVVVNPAGQELGAASKSLPHGAQSPALANLPINKLVRLATLPDLPHNLAKHYDLALRTPITGTALSLVTVLPDSLIYGHIPSREYFFVAAAGPLVFLMAVLWISRIQERTRKLETDVIESSRNRSELQDKNEALTQEIARREALEYELRKSEERHRTYIEHAPEGIFIADSTGTFVDVNPAICAMVGYTHDELLGMKVTDLFSSGLTEDHAALHQQEVRSGAQEVEIKLHCKDGKYLIVNLRALSLPDDSVMGYCVDITERKHAEEQIRHLAYFDPLTALPNRRMLMDRLRRAMAASAREMQFGALLILDLDHFKNLNDTQGHDIGDRLLIQVARRLTSTVRQEDAVARLGGDEYVVVIEALGQDESAAALHSEMIAEKVRNTLAQPYFLQDERFAYHSTPSIGVTLFQGKDVAADLVLKQADVALYQAKNAGRNTVRFFNPDMQAAIDARALMESALRRGITQQELRLHYQPQVDSRGNVTGAEALLRWLPPDSNPIPPVRFIPLAEETGLIIPIGAWVLEQACAQLQRWRVVPSTRDLVLSINVSARQFHQPDFVQQLLDKITQYEIDPSRLKLELTESVVLARVDEVVERMQSLKSLGVGFSLDDFGTGYSSLSYLKRLPLDQVKIDQSFVRDITHDQNDMAIVRAIIAMTQTLGLNVIAEGVETEEQRALLLKYGCENYQGYLFGRPASIEEFPAPAESKHLACAL